MNLHQLEKQVKSGERILHNWQRFTIENLETQVCRACGQVRRIRNANSHCKRVPYVHPKFRGVH